MSSSKIQSIESVQNTIIQRAGENPEYRSALLEDPRKAICEEFDIDFPEVFDIVVHESKGTSLHLALPPQIEELDEEQLSAISAGQQNFACVPEG